MAQLLAGPSRRACLGAHTRGAAPFRPAASRCQAQQRRMMVVRSAEPKAEPKAEESPLKGEVIENPDSESARKQAEIERLRAAEKFMVVGSGEATCTGCGYEYKPERGDPEFPVPRGMKFQDISPSYQCPICGAPKDKFESKVMVVAGFAENQKYGFGTNAMTGGQKQLLIWGSFGVFFLFFILGYGLN